MITNYFNHRIQVSKASNGAFMGTVLNKIDGRVLHIEPRETQGRALAAAKALADQDVADAVAAVSRGERF